MKKVCFICGSGADKNALDRICGPQRLPVELAKRIKDKYQVNFISYQRNFFSLFSIIRKLKKINPDIIHGHGSLNMALLLLILKNVLHKKTILTFTDFKKNITNNYSILNHLNSVIVQTDYAKKKLISKGVNPAKLYKITYGIEDSFYKAKECKKIRKLANKIVLYYGDARQERGFYQLIQSIKYIDNDIFILICLRNFHKGFDKKSVENLQKKRKNIKIMAIKDYPCPIQDIIASVDAVVLPFIKNTLEPPLTIMEVSAIGKLLITTNVGGNKEIASKAILIDRITPEKLAESINKSITRKSNIKKTTYSWKPALKLIKEIY